MTEEHAAQARRLRVEEGLSVGQIQQRLGASRHQVRQWVDDLPPPGWTRRPNAKDEQRAMAEQLRRTGWSVPEIADEVGVARSTAFQWTRHIPLDGDGERARRRREHSKRMTDARWETYRAARDTERLAVAETAASWLGELTARDLMLIGALIYWCEGEKAKPWRPHMSRLCFTNSDPGLVELFISFVEVLGVPRTGLTYRVSIHESADADAATEWWAARIGVPAEDVRRPTIKRHNPRTNRLNTVGDYRGCLTVQVPRGRKHYWWIEGLVAAVSEAVVSGQRDDG